MLSLVIHMGYKGCDITEKYTEPASAGYVIFSAIIETFKPTSII